ncbi:MAG: GNAT family N-acyltransferase [Acidobacteriota bacterium]
MLLNETATWAPDDVAYPTFRDGLPADEIRDGRYFVRFVDSLDELDKVLRLRFEVFNLELGEGLDSSFATGRDRDRYDRSCHHLAVYDSRYEQLVGTYRIQTSAMAATAHGFYSANEFDLSAIPMNIVDQSVELGRACILPEHRNTQVLFLLWKGLASYCRFNAKRFLFGCCSLTSQDPGFGLSTYDYLRRQHLVHPEVFAEPRAEFECRAHSRESEGEAIEVNLPRLFRTYLRFGAKVCSPPAIDRQFKTIDFLVLFDTAAMDVASHRLFFGE